MRSVVNGIISRFEARISKKNSLRPEGIAVHSLVQFKILGQSSLFLNESASAKLPLLATTDIDALIEGDALGRDLLIKIINETEFSYDKESPYIWIPEASQFDTIYSSKLIVCRALQPLYALVSKAVKAPAKNQLLLIRGLDVYGDELIQLIRAYGGNIERILEGEFDED